MEDRNVFIHEVKLMSKDEFSERFNYVGDLFKKAKETDSDEDWNRFAEAKYCLEQGLPIAFSRNQ